MEPDTGLDTLLDLNGYIVDQDLDAGSRSRHGEWWQPRKFLMAFAIHSRSTNRMESGSWDMTIATL
jgi:hypothetical protein